MLTGVTITDAQIRELRESAADDDTRAACARALNAGRMWATHEIARARAHCAEILNARNRT